MIINTNERNIMNVPQISSRDLIIMYIVRKMIECDVTTFMELYEKIFPDKTIKIDNGQKEHERFLLAAGGEQK